MAAAPVTLRSTETPRELWAKTAVLSAPIVVLSGASFLGNVLAPALVASDPVLLVALVPRRAYLAVAATAVPLPATWHWACSG